MDGEQSNEPLTLEALGDLSARNNKKLLWLRERLIMDVERIHQESVQAQQEIKTSTVAATSCSKSTRSGGG